MRASDVIVFFSSSLLQALIRLSDGVKGKHTNVTVVDPEGKEGKDVSNLSTLHHTLLAAAV